MQLPHSSLRRRVCASLTLALAIALVRVVPAQFPDARLPDRIGDGEFWRLVSEFSEPGGAFRSERRASKAQQSVPRLSAGVTPSVIVWKRKPWNMGITAMSRTNAQRTSGAMLKTSSTSQSKATDSAKSRHCSTSSTRKASGAGRNNRGIKYQSR